MFTPVVHLNAVQYCSMLLDLLSPLVSAVRDVREPQNTYLLHRIAMYYQYIDVHCTSAASNGLTAHDFALDKAVKSWMQVSNAADACPMNLCQWKHESNAGSDCDKTDMCAMRAEYAAYTL